MSKPNSVQWFFDQLVSHGYIVVDKTTYGDKVKAKHEIILEQAKAMHKEEIMKAFNKGNQMGNSPFSDSEWYYMIKFECNNEQQ